MKQYKLINNVLGWIIFVIASYTYLMTIESSASFWDCGEFILSAFKLEVGHPPGAPIFMLVANLFTQFASSTATVAKMVNSMSALFSALTILFLFWSITHLARRILLKDGDKELTLARTIIIMGCGVVGALAYTWSDTFWFSAVEGEVYAFSSLFTAVVFWLILKWEEVADQPHADRWIVLIAYFMGLSIGVHLLNLLCIPAIVLVYYYKKFPNPTTKGVLIAIGISFVIVALMLYGVVQGLVEVCGLFELLFVNVFGMPYNTGVYVFVIAVAATLAWAIWETTRDEIHPTRLRISFILSVVLLGIPFIGSGYLLGIVLIIALTIAMFYYKKLNIKLLNTTLTSLMVIAIGYSSFALILIRSTADTPMNQNKPSDIFTLGTYLAREQYGETPLIYGNTYVSEIKRNNDGTPVTKGEGKANWSRVIKSDPKEKDHYYVSTRIPKYAMADETLMLFPRMYSSDPNHINGYKSWANITGEKVNFRRMGETVTVIKPTFAENIRFFISYQLNYMYWRYFMWNFSGRQNDIQGHNGDLLNGNFITGIKFIDEMRLGPQDDMSYDIVNNKGHNVYFMLPLLLGLLGIAFQLISGKKGMQSFWITALLFFMTGIAIVLYLNQTPLQPRERDYAYAGSFYAFCIWIGLGVAGVAYLLERYAKAPALISGIVASIVCLYVPYIMVSQNWDDHDRSGRYIARDFGSNYLNSCEPDAIIFTNGDNDTFPLWYAQEVEGVRTDVRVCNTSYLQTDWYTDQMKRQAYTSDPLPITWTRRQYVQGTRDHAYIFNSVPQVDLQTALTFVESEDPKYKRIRGYAGDVDYIPSEKILYKVDTEAVIANNVLNPVDTGRILKEMLIDLSGKTAIGKEAITILDMLNTNNWKRPMYYAITVSPDQFVKLDNYLQKTGLAYRIVPINAHNESPINTEKMYDNVMNKFRWGGIEKPGLYIDETVMRMCKSYRTVLFSELASALHAEGQDEKAIAVLDKGMEVLPFENVPLDYSALSMADMYVQLNQQEKAEQLLNAIADHSMRAIRWMFRFPNDKQLKIQRDLELHLSVVQSVLSVGMRHNEHYGKPFREEYNEYRMAYTSSRQSAQ
ncbi:MAG: DUF2723 domain-containing protein [Tannerella sp.]|jgi:hypothetical protein|nr:DUF2723 domain-containing protein [Tannerella sp.]